MGQSFLQVLFLYFCKLLTINQTYTSLFYKILHNPKSLYLHNPCPETNKDKTQLKVQNKTAICTCIQATQNEHLHSGAGHCRSKAKGQSPCCLPEDADQQTLQKQQQYRMIWDHHSSLGEWKNQGRLPRGTVTRVESRRTRVIK